MKNLKNFIISEKVSIIEAMNLINKNAKGIAFICDGNKLLAVVTDGNIRRYILQNGDLNASVKYVANYSPKFIVKNEGTIAKKYMLEHSITAVPILNKKHELLSIEFLDESSAFKNTNLNIPVVIMAGGKGTRLAPYTNVLPKPLIPVTDKTITELIMERFELFGCNQFDMIVNYKKNLIKAYFAESNRKDHVTFTDENKFLGTGGGLRLIKGKYPETIIVTNCDILIEEDYGAIIDYHKENNNTVTMVCAMKDVTIPYGSVMLNKDGNLEGIDEKPNYSFMANTGMYVIEQKFIDKIQDDTYMHITEIIEECVRNGEKVGVYPISGDAWMDMGQINELEKMRKRFE